MDRGYTGHEHLQSVGLINMNGRLYDPKLHRFLQPDNYVQDPNNTQNYNRYGYVLNNPLKYTDPSGEFFFVAMIVGAVIGAYIGGSKANENWNPIKWDWSSGKTWAGIGTGALIGAVAGEVAWAGITGQMAFGIFNVSLGAGVAIPGVGTLGAFKSGEYWGSQFTNPQGQTFNQNIGTVPVVKPKSDTNGNGGGQGGNLSPAQQAIINARNSNRFYGNQVLINSEHGDNNWSFLGVIHTSRDWYESYKTYGLKGKAGLLFMHEYGHYLDSQYNPLRWYGHGMWSSMWTRNDPDASSNWTEIQANTMSYYYFHMPPVFLQNKNEYPIDVNSISQDLKIKLYYHRKL